MQKKEPKYWLHRVNYEAVLAYPLLQEGWLSMGFSDYGVAHNIDDVKENIEGIIVNECEGYGKNRNYLKAFINEIGKGDYVIVPLGKNFNIYKVLNEKIITAKSFDINNVKDYYGNEIKRNVNGYLETCDRIIDLGFFRKVKLLAGDIPILKIKDTQFGKWDTTYELIDVKNIIADLTKHYKSKEESSIKEAIRDSKQILEEININAVANTKELIAQYLTGIGFKLLEDKESTDVVKAYFEPLESKIIVRIQDSKENTRDWASKQITSYKQSQYKKNESTLLWLLSSDYYLSEKVKSEAGLGIRLISRKDFLEMCLNMNLHIKNPYKVQWELIRDLSQIKLTGKVLENQGDEVYYFTDKSLVYPVIFELKNIKNLQKIIFDHLRIAKKRYGIITDGDFFSIYDKEDGGSAYITQDIDEITAILNNNKNIAKKRVQQQIKNINAILKFNDKSFNKNQINTKKMCFKKKSDEEAFWESLFDKGTYKKICKYTSINALKAIVESKKIRMSGLAGMNDTTEVNYLEEYCLSDREFIPQDDNKVFIVSCNPNVDDLPMWRLYASDAEGVCIEFDKTVSVSKNFYFHKIQYAERRGFCSKLNIVKSLINNGFKLNKFDKWKHFFKPYDYRMEEEYRLLYINSNKNLIWTNLEKERILNPSIEFDLKNFPLKIKRVILGPKFPERSVNVRQIQKLIDDKNIYSNGVGVTSSEIEVYR